MNAVNSKYIKIAKRYARALADFDERDVILKDLNYIQNVFETSQDLKSFLVNPIITVSDKKDIISKVFTDLSVNTLTFLSRLIDQNRFEYFSTILSEFKRILDDINNIIRVEILSAVELTKDEKVKIEEKLQSKLKSNIASEYKTDEGIIAGLVIKIGDKVVDNSLKTRFSELEKQLI